MRAKPFGTDDGRSGSLPGDLGKKVMAVELLSAQRDKEVCGTALARVGRDLAEPGLQREALETDSTYMRRAQKICYGEIHVSNCEV